MPPRDPRKCPALERALPADDLPGSTHVPGWPERRLVLFGDGEWHPVSVTAWRRDREGAVVIDVEWYADGSGWSESYRYDGERVRKGSC